MKYIKLEIAADQQNQEALIAELMDLGFDEFQQTDDALITYIPKEQFLVGDRERIEQLLSGFPGNGYIRSEEIVGDQNWNESWERTIQAQHIGRFLVRPTWASDTAGPDEILLEIDPKMSFGTGYHETTRLMLRALPDIIREGDRVLDAGTGTGILAIGSVKLGAGAVLGFDIDEWSVTNARENIYLNEVPERITIRKGNQDTVGEADRFDVILANIQQNVISEMIPFFASHLEEDGKILLSGLLRSDESKIRDHLRSNGLRYLETFRENEWIAIRGGK